MKTTATLTLVLAILIAILAVLSGFGVRMEWWGFPVGFKLLKAAFILGLINGGIAIIVSAAKEFITDPADLQAFSDRVQANSLGGVRAHIRGTVHPIVEPLG